VCVCVRACVRVCVCVYIYIFTRPRKGKTLLLLNTPMKFRVMLKSGNMLTIRVIIVLRITRLR
jgi:hypothetical protein